jgi:hypothetical protein
MCCGNSRGRSLQGVSAMPAPRMPAVARPAGLTFEYVGRTALAVTGPVTGRQYRFERPGSRLDVDPRDSASVGAIPVLKRVTASAGRR